MVVVEDEQVALVKFEVMVVEVAPPGLEVLDRLPVNEAPGLPEGRFTKMTPTTAATIMISAATTANGLLRRKRSVCAGALMSPIDRLTRRALVDSCCENRSDAETPFDSKHRANY